MRLPRTKLSISLLLLLGMTGAFAGPGDRDGERALRQQNERGDYQFENRSSPYRGYNESSHSDINRAAGQTGNANEGSRRQGRMSPEEKRALRQQINEAGQDIYYRKP